MIDVAVSGGGPAGSACAALLARDHDVVVLEEHPSVGRPMQCAGLISDASVKLSGVSPEVYSVFHGARVHFPGGDSVAISSDAPLACSVDREGFDRRMADRALDAGAEFRTGVRLESYHVSDRVRLETSAGPVESRLLVGADGHSSATAAGLGVRPPEFIRGIQADVRVRADDQDSFVMRLGSRYAPGFFTWEIPCGDFTRVGLCTSWSAGPPAPYLRRLLSDLGWEGRTDGMHSGKIPIGRMQRMSGDRVMLVGDAASQVKPVSGGGIHPILSAAPILAGVASSALDSDDLGARRLGEYDRIWNSGPGRELRRGMRLRRAYLRMDDGDLDRAGAYASREDVREVLGSIDIDGPTEVVRRLLSRPSTALRGVWTLLRCVV